MCGDPVKGTVAEKNQNRGFTGLEQLFLEGLLQGPVAFMRMGFASQTPGHPRQIDTVALGIPSGTEDLTKVNLIGKVEG